ncbi:MAG: hypothetical protein AB7U82_04910 [Blastocatellales bacterium]
MPLPPIQITMEEATDPKEIAEFQARWAQAQRNSDWLQAHAHEIYTRHRGKFIVVAGEELIVGDTPEEALALARAAHPEDEGRIIRYIYPKKMARVYGNLRRIRGESRESKECFLL